jgi:hypothetical protein
VNDIPVKKTPDNQLTGQKGINVIEAVVLEMNFLWHPAGPFDAGIDGRIELRDARTGNPLNRHIGVQSKARTKFTAETDDVFEFLCEASDIDYWMGSQDPVILVCSHPARREAWFRCVTDWFADAERRAARRVVFDKTVDRFDQTKAPELLRLAARDEPALVRMPPAPPEDLIANLLPIVTHSDRIWSAPALVDDHEEAQVRYQLVGGLRASDYLLRDKRLYSLRDPAECPLRHLCDIGRVASFPASRWAASEDPTLLRYWVESLRRALLQQTKRQLRWHPKRHLFYFPAPDPLADMSVEGPNGRRQVIKVAYYFDKRRGEDRLKYVRHHAFRPAFELIDGTWHLAIEPEYLFTYDGERANFRGDEYLAGIKRLDRNPAVLGQLRMWEHLLTRPPGLLHQEPPLLVFGNLKEVSVPVGIDDALWRSRNRSGDGVAGQQELAA